MSDEDREPTEKMDELFESIEDREGDPFDRFDDATRGDPFGSQPDASQSQENGPAAAESDPEHFDALGFERSGRPEEADGDPESSPSTDPLEDTPGPVGGADDPFGTLDRAHRDGDPFESLDTRSGVEDPDADAELWESLTRQETEPEIERRGQRRYAEVSKHSYCERCEYFSSPPDVSCSHEGTDIIEFVDSETVRLADCPVVAEREALANLDADR